MTRPKITDLIVPGSVRVERVVLEQTVMTVRCGRCGSEFDALASGHTKRCRRCRRVCQLDSPVVIGDNVPPIRRRA